LEILIPKKTGTYADSLCAVGYASLLAELRDSSSNIEDVGHSYRVICEEGTPPEDWKPPSPGFLYIWRRKKGLRPLGSQVMDYEQEQALAEAAKKSRSIAKAKKKVIEALEEASDVAVPANDPEYRFAAIIESMRSSWSSDLALYHWIYENPSACLTAIRARINGDNQKFDAKWSNSQLLNPSTGKGIHASKTIAKGAGSFTLTDTFEEWMKVRGLWASMLGFRSGGDFKFFAISPGRITLGHLTKLRNELRDLGMWGIVRLDIEAMLRLLQSLMLHSEYKEKGGIPIQLFTPNQVVQGLQFALFKKLGMGSALMNDSILPLPSWFAVNDGDDVDAYLEICSEPFGSEKGKYGPLSALKDDHSDDVELLQKYRRWLTSGKLKDLLEFHVSFAPHLLQRLTAGPAQAFQSQILHLLLLKGYPEVKDIIESPGFQNIARAIRNTTIYAAGMKSSNRDVRFGFAQKLKQRIKAGDREFLAELSDFVQQQNWEIVHRLKGRGFQIQIADSDLNDIVGLTEKYHAELVGMLLLAYGFSKADKVVDKGEEGGEVEAAAL